MITKKKVLVVLLALCSLTGFAQESNYSYKLYGFVRSDYYTDTRKMSASVLDFFSFYPMYQNLNAAGEDLNALSSASLVSVNSRIGLDLTGPAGIFGATKTLSRLETDFGGSPNYTLLRIRQAFTQLIWSKSDLLIGQTWHPFFVPATMPNVISLNAGSPFQPFNRSPMIRYNYQMDKLKLTAAAIYQMMYTTQGPDEANPTKTAASASYQKNAIIPEIFVGLEYKKDKMLVGLGGAYKSIMPNRFYTDGNNIKHVNHNVLSTPSAMAYAVYNSGKLAVRAKAILGQNMTESCLIGGFAVTPDNKYIPYNTLSSYIHFNYGKTHQLGLMVGYTANLGPSKTLPVGSNFYGFGVDNANTSNEKMVGNIFRIAPTYTYNIKNWQLGLELEYTKANWGQRSANGKILNLDPADNYRIYAILMYTF
jgi:hypothetical protein